MHAFGATLVFTRLFLVPLLVSRALLDSFPPFTELLNARLAQRALLHPGTDRQFVECVINSLQHRAKGLRSASPWPKYLKLTTHL